jgi:hypothetical protein
MPEAPALIATIAVFSFFWKLEGEPGSDAQWRVLSEFEGSVGTPCQADGELVRRRRQAPWRCSEVIWRLHTSPAPRFERDFGAMYAEDVGQADQGCDFDFLRGTTPTAEPEIH